MNLAHHEKGLYLPFSENRGHVLVIEHTRMLSDVMQELYAQSEGKEGGFVVAQDAQLFRFSQTVTVILEPFSLQCNEKKRITALYKHLEEEAITQLYPETLALHAQILHYIEKLFVHLPYPLVCADTLDLSALWKAVQIAFDDAAENLCESILHYLQILATFTKIRIVIFLHLKTYLSPAELQEIYQYAFYQKLYLLLIESHMHDKMDCEDIWIIDSDLCMISFS